MIGRTAFTCFLVVFLCDGPSRASTPSQDAGVPRQERDEYTQLIDAALAEFELHQYTEALTLFEQAYRRKPSARALRGAAKALFELRAYRQCMETVERALTTALEPLSDALRTDVEELRARAARFVGRVIVSVSPPSALVVLDGVSVAEPANSNAFWLDAGPHTLEVSASHYQGTRRSFIVRGDETSTVEVVLTPATVTVLPGPPDVRLRTRYIAAGVGALALGGVVASAFWFVGRDSAVLSCTSAALHGARCENASSIAFERDASMWTVGISALSAVVAAIAYTALSRDRDVHSSLACGKSGLIGRSGACLRW